MSMKVDPDWWKTMFNEVYLLTDARSVCDEDITRREVDLICELLPILDSDQRTFLLDNFLSFRACFTISAMRTVSVISPSLTS